ncbi:MAG TPA: aspartate kinase [Actinomycetota bacterium]|nr:aspartate kinase [Actinomycetota bacterium]
MGVVVQKFGGTSVGTAERIKKVAERVVAARDAGNDVVVVVSAMGHTTDELVDLAAQISPNPPGRELDMLLTAGERISMALLAMAISELGHEAVSFTGSQAGIITTTEHGRAKIMEVRAHRLHEAIEQGKIVIVAGFQGVSETADVTTLGRGGSDTTAVALAAALKADVCDIYTDVDGVYTADPRIVPTAKLLHAVSYEEMLEMAASGARVLMARSVEYARNYGVLVRVASSFSDAPGTFVREEDERMEKAIISGVTHDTSEAKVTVEGVLDRPGVAARLFSSVARAGINIDMIVQNVSHAGRTDISFTIPRDEIEHMKSVLVPIADELGANGVSYDAGIAKVSLIGAGMKSHPGVAADMFDALSQAGVNIEMISTSTIRISCVIREVDTERAVRAIHDRFVMSDGDPTRSAHPA